MNRRTLLKAFSFVAASCVCGGARAQDGYRGCRLNADGADKFYQTNNLLNKSGIDFIDETFHIEVNILDQYFRVKPDFSFFDDGYSTNAFATTENLIGESPHGSVCFGVNLLKSELSERWWGPAIAGIAAHEWAHIGQFASGLRGPVWKMELHADFLAGWYLGRKQINGTPVLIEGLGQSLFGKGSFDFNHPDWHGTPDQRVRSMIAGYLSARNAPDVGIAYEIGRRHIEI